MFGGYTKDAASAKQSILRMAILLDDAERKRPKRTVVPQSVVEDDQGEAVQEDVYKQTLWQIIQKKPNMSQDVLESRTLIQWNNTMHIPLILRQRLLQRILDQLMAIEIYKDVLKKDHCQPLDSDKLELFVQEAVRAFKANAESISHLEKEGKTLEDKLYEESQSKVIYKNLSSSLLSKLKHLPDDCTEQDTQCLDVPKEDKDKACASVSRNDDGDRAMIEVPSRIEENDIKSCSESSEEKGDFEIHLNENQKPLVEEKKQLSQLDEALVLMRCRHNRSTADTIRKQIEKDRHIYQKLNQLLEIDSSLDVKAWKDKIEISHKVKEGLQSCGLVSSDEEDENEQDGAAEGSTPLEAQEDATSTPSRSKSIPYEEIVAKVKDFVKGVSFSICTLA